MSLYDRVRSLDNIEDYTLIACGFLAPIGVKANYLTGLPITLIYPVFVAFSIILWVRGKKGKRKVLKFFKYLTVFVFIHTFITFFIVLPDAIKNEFNDIFDIIQVLLYWLTSFSYMYLMKNKKKMSLFTTAYTIGFVISVIVGFVVRDEFYNQINRYSSGFLNPNVFAVSAWIVIVTNMILTPRGKGYNIVSNAVLVLGLVSVLISGSRGVIVAVGVFFLTYIIMYPGIKRKSFIIVSILTLSSVALLIAPDKFLVNTEERMHRTVNRPDQPFVKHEESRIRIWKFYLERYNEYLFTGVGLRRAKNAFAGMSLNTHNLYLSLFVMLGAGGLILFLLFMAKLFFLFYPEGLVNKNSVNIGIFSMFISMAIMLVFNDYIGGRDVYIGFAFLLRLAADKEILFRT